MKGQTRTDNEDQTARLLKLLPKSYSSHSSTFYWKASFVPHPRIMGSVGMKVSTISKYKMTKGLRHQLAVIPGDWLTQQFNLKRAILENHFPIEGSPKDLVILNTHFDAFAQGTNTMELQANEAKSILDGLTAKGFPVLIGGDFNLLAPGKSYDRLRELEKRYFNVPTELAPLFEVYQSVPTLNDINGPAYKKWYTHYPNGTRSTAPDRTIDYMFISKDIKITKRSVRQKDTLEISDHLPVITEIVVP